MNTYAKYTANVFVAKCTERHEKGEHSYTLTYAKKAVNEAQKNLDTAKKIWGEQ